MRVASYSATTFPPETGDHAATTRRPRCRSRTAAGAPEIAFTARARPAPDGLLAAVHRQLRQPGVPGAGPAARPQRLRRRADRRVLDRAAGALLRAGRSLATATRSSLLDAQDRTLASTVMTMPGNAAKRPSIVYEVPLAPAGNGLVLRGQGYRTSIGLISNTLFWMVVALSVLTVWMLLGTWRHMRAAPADAGRAGVGDQLPPRDGELDADRHARDGPGRPHHLRQPGVLRDDRLRRRRTDRPAAAVPALAARPPRGERPPAAAGAAGPEPARRHRGQGDAQGRLAVRRAHVRLAADRRQGPADRLDDLDDQHHRGQAHPRPALGLARALHDRARRASTRRCRCCRCSRASCCSPTARTGCGSAPTRKGHARARRRAKPGTPSHAGSDEDGRRPRRPADAGADRSRLRLARGLRRVAAEVVRRARALPAVDRRPAGADADRDRHHRAPPRRDAGREPGREGAGDEPAGDDGRDGVVGRARAEPAADRDHELLQRHGDARQERRDREGRPDRRAAEDLAPGRARRPDHPPHPRLREAQRAAAPARRTPRTSSTTRSTSPASSCAAATSRSTPTSRSACRR